MEVYFGLALKSFLDQVVSGDLESLNLGAVHNAPQHQQEIRNLALIQQSHQQQQMAFNSGQAQPGYGQTQPIYGQGPPPSYGQVPPPSYGQVQPTYGQPPNSYR